MSNVAFNTKCSIFPQRWKECKSVGGSSTVGSGVFASFSNPGMNNSGDPASAIQYGPPFRFDPTTTTTSRVYFPTEDVNSGDITATQFTGLTTPPPTSLVHAYTEFNLPVGVYQVKWHAVLAFVLLSVLGAANPNINTLQNPNVVFGILARPTAGAPTIVGGTIRPAEFQANTVYAASQNPQDLDIARGNGIAFGNVILVVSDPTVSYSIAYLDGDDFRRTDNLISFASLENPGTFPVPQNSSRSAVTFAKFADL